LGRKVDPEFARPFQLQEQRDGKIDPTNLFPKSHRERAGAGAQLGRKIVSHLIHVYANPNDGLECRAGACFRFHQDPCDFSIAHKNIVRRFDRRLEPGLALNRGNNRVSCPVR